MTARLRTRRLYPHAPRPYSCHDDAFGTGLARSRAFALASFFAETASRRNYASRHGPKDRDPPDQERPVPMPTIALVDDDRNILTSVSIALEAEGHRVQTYSDGASALDG